MIERAYDLEPFPESVEHAGIILTIERYNELLRAERDAEMLKALIAEKAPKGYESICPSELELLALIFGLLPKELEESEGAENG